MLRFCYTGECLVARGSVLALLLLADRFAVPALQAACEEARCVQKHDGMRHAGSCCIGELHAGSQWFLCRAQGRPMFLKS